MKYKHLTRSLFWLGAVGISIGMTVVNSAPIFAAPLDDLVSGYERRYHAMTEQDDSGYGYLMSDELFIFSRPECTTNHKSLIRIQHRK